MALAFSKTRWLAWASGVPAPRTEPTRVPLEPARIPEAPGSARPPQHPSRSGLILFFLLGILGGYALYQQFQQAPSAAPVAVIRTAQVVRGDLHRVLRLSGTISARNSSPVVAPRIRGPRSPRGAQLTLVQMAEPGSLVKKADVVAEFDRQEQLERIDDQQALVTQAESDIKKQQAQLAIDWEVAQQQLRTAKAEVEKAKLDLQTAEVRSEIEAEKLKLAVEEAEAQFGQLEKEVGLLESAQKADLRSVEIARDREKINLVRAELNARTMLMRSPIDGLVVMMTIYRGGGQFAQVQTGDELYPGSYFMQIVDPSEMQLMASLNQVDSQLVRVGQQAELRLDAYPDRVWPGRVSAVAAIAGVEGSRGRGPRRSSGDYVRHLPVTITIESRDPLIIPDLSGSADVILAAHKDMLLVPREAIHQKDGETLVYFKPPNSDQFVPRSVELGAENPTHVAVVAGLSAGDEVALSIPEGP